VDAPEQAVHSTRTTPAGTAPYSVISNTSDGAWPVETELERRLL